MPCPTCDHTMHNIGTAGVAGVFWCPRCGTLKTGDPEPDIFTPKLVERCREFAKSDYPELHSGQLWTRLGIAESINV